MMGPDVPSISSADVAWRGGRAVGVAVGAALSIGVVVGKPSKSPIIISWRPPLKARAIFGRGCPLLPPT